ncbi:MULTISPECIES: hypothetical protein [unclassified Pseudoalteromonas]|uniref:hypothetical protein n=1 Tax=unclassified Pseudoalteromonas TaxID=194690 RepID=UPI0018CF91B7|nr:MULTISPECIES: hypothetical protein [unclassified Pseudoalteromonas]MBG9991565.1 hypothetical protein [Pseudoalteromonas sp. NZS37]MBH0088635.1 hypothetical protein [Pseudoalteromonas sp. NSLLW218]
MKRITPANLRELRKKLGLSSQQAADSVYKNRRLWQRYEAPVTASSSLNIPPATLELFCLKHGLPYPPNKQGKLGKLVSFYGGQSGAGHTSLTIDICTALMADGYEVLVISDPDGCAMYGEMSVKHNYPFPRTIEVESSNNLSFTNDLVNLPYSSSPGALKPIIDNYDFVFLDIGFMMAEKYFDVLEPDLIIGPAKINELPDRNGRAFNNLEKLAARFSEQKNNKTKLALLMVAVSTGYAFSPGYYGLFDSSADDYEEERDIYFKQQEVKKLNQEKLLELFKGLIGKPNMFLMNSYTSDAYDSYRERYAKGYSIFNKAPNSLPAHELRSVKNEILRLLGVPERAY